MTTGKSAFEQRAEALAAELLDSGDLDKIPALQPLIDGYLYRDTMARVIGQSGHMKSFVVLDIAARVGSGMQWHGRKVSQGSVIYLVAEGGGGVRKRVRAWEQYYGCKMTGVRFLPRPVQAGDVQEWCVLTEVCRRSGPALIILDTQARITVGVEENSSKEMGEIIERVEELRRATQACVLLVHHQGLQGEHGRGSTAVKAALQTELRVTKKGRGEQARVHLATDKQKDDEEPEDLVFVAEVVKLNGEFKDDGSPVTSVVLLPAHGIPSAAGEPKLTPAATQVLGALQQAKGSMSVARIIDAVSASRDKPLTRETVSRKLNELLEYGLVECSEQGRGKASLWSISAAEGCDDHTPLGDHGIERSHPRSHPLPVTLNAQLKARGPVIDHV